MEIERLPGLKRDVLMRSPQFPETVKIIAAYPRGSSVKLQAVGAETDRFYDLVLDEEQLDNIELVQSREPYSGDSRLFRLAIDAIRWGLAYEYDPYFSW